MTLIYCLKCKRKTKSIYEQKENKDEKWRLLAKCAECDSKKSQYIKAPKCSKKEKCKKKSYKK